MSGSGPDGMTAIAGTAGIAAIAGTAGITAIAGTAHTPAGAPVGAVLLTHGAGGNRDSPLLIALCDEWARRGWLAVRYDLPFRRRRPTGPPSGSAATDRAGIAEAVSTVRALTDGPLFAGGHSYGGRLTSMVAAAETVPIDALVLSSYPLHPPGKSDSLRTGHFGAIRVPTLFSHGTNDPFGSLAELRTAATLIPAPTDILEVSGARHDLGFGKASTRRPSDPGGTKDPDLATLAVDAALRLWTAR
ncbi:MAG TPA: alpha/beta hydrolase [Mycobacterium sp.]|jgi:predicted alpha/beta-hydrolase family hydrolase|nr:alpha/beta hydrolase [Mycobacterium sp.]